MTWLLDGNVLVALRVESHLHHNRAHRWFATLEAKAGVKHLPKRAFHGFRRRAVDVLLKKPVHPITVRNVLSHTAGMRFSSPMEKPTLDMLTLRDAVRSYAMMPLLHEPDSKYLYSNAGINTAARIIEVLSGTDKDV